MTGASKARSPLPRIFPADRAHHMIRGYQAVIRARLGDPGVRGGLGFRGSGGSGDRRRWMTGRRGEQAAVRSGGGRPLLITGSQRIERDQPDLIGDRWTLLVIRDLLAGKSHFQEFLRSPERIATNILAARLERLQAGGLVETQPSELRAGAFRYVLTARGRTLRPVLRAMEKWGLSNVPGTESRIRPRGDVEREVRR